MKPIEQKKKKVRRTHFVVVVEGQSTDFAVVRVGVLLWDVLKGAVGNVGVGGNGLFILTSLCLVQDVFRHLPEAHGAVPGPWDREITSISSTHRKAKSKETHL